MDALTSTWPLFGLRLTTGDVAAEGIHPAGEMSFGVPWTRAEPARFQRRFVQHHRVMRGSWSPDDWSLNLGTFVGGRPVGSQSLVAEGFAVRRVVSTGSWLGRAHQGRGTGTAMTRKLGYRPDRDEHLDRKVVRPRPEVEITGLDACRELFGA